MLVLAAVVGAAALASPRVRLGRHVAVIPASLAGVAFGDQLVRFALDCRVRDDAQFRAITGNPRSVALPDGSTTSRSAEARCSSTLRVAQSMRRTKRSDASGRTHQPPGQ